MEFETRALRIVVRPDDIIELITKPNWNQPDTVEIALENIEMLKKAVDDKPRGVLSYVPSTYMSKEVLACYEKANVGQVASALITLSFGAKIVGNLFLKVGAALSNGTNREPTKLFSNKPDAEKWLLARIAEKKAETT